MIHRGMTGFSRAGLPPRRPTGGDIGRDAGTQEMMMLFQMLAFPVTGPLRTIGWIGGAIRDAVDRKMNDPAEIKRALAALEHQLEAGSISEQEYEQMEMELMERLQGLSQQPRPASTTSDR
jgi:uncharacterized membrane protein